MQRLPGQLGILGLVHIQPRIVKTSMSVHDFFVTSPRYALRILNEKFPHSEMVNRGRYFAEKAQKCPDR